MRENAVLSQSSERASGESKQYLTFSLGGEIFAIETLCIKEIIEYGQLTVVPMMPKSIRGVINLRGSVVPVIDLGARFFGSRTEIARRTCIVILEVESGDKHQVLGVIVDAVTAVMEMEPADVEPPPDFGARIQTDFIKGMGKIKNRFVIILEVGKVLSIGDLANLAAMTEQ